MDSYELKSLLESFKEAKEYIPRIKTDTNYWLTRANGGLFYDAFRTGMYIAIGWNEITLEDLETLTDDQIKEKLLEHNPKMEKPGSAYNQLIRFAYQIKIGDIVTVPSEAPNDLLIGEVIGTVYNETIENMEAETYRCPFNKRLKVRWLGTIYNRDIDSELYKILYSGQTIISANNYKKYINRGLYDSYIDESESTMSVTFKVRDEGNVSAIAYSNFISNLIQLIELFSENELEDEDIVIRTNVQSDGPIELLSNPVAMENVSMLLSWVFKFASLGTLAFLGNKTLNSGGNFKLKKENTNIEFEAKINSPGQEDINKAIASKIEFSSEEEQLSKAIDIINNDEFKNTVQELEIEFPETIEKSLEKAFEDKNTLD